MRVSAAKHHGKRVSVFLSRIREVIPEMLADITEKVDQIGNAQGKKTVALEEPIWSEAEIEGDEVILRHMPAYLVTWEGTRLPDNYEKRVFSRGTLTLRLFVEKEQGTSNASDYAWDFEETLINNLDDRRQSLRLLQFESMSSTNAPFVAHEQVLAWKFDFQCRIGNP